MRCQSFHRAALLVLTLSALFSIESRGDSLGLEAGLLTSGTFPHGAGKDEKYAALGLSARANYRFARWELGVSSRGQISLSSPFAFSTDSFYFSGDLARRFVSLGAVGRYLLVARPDGEQVYLDFGFFGVQNDLVNASDSFDFILEEGEEKLFVRGYGVSLGGGYRFRSSPLFLQLNYEYQRYDWAQVVGQQNQINQVLVEQPINGAIFGHMISLTFGLWRVF